MFLELLLELLKDLYIYIYIESSFLSTLNMKRYTNFNNLFKYNKKSL
jgi:hypothetical protein